MKIDFRLFTNHFVRSELLRSATVLITGTVLAQLISILLQPLLRRLISTEIYGTYSVYLSIVAIIAIIASLRYDDAIVLPSKDKESANVLFLALLSNFIINLILLIVILFFGKRIIVFLNIPSGLPISILYFIPLSVVLYNTYQCFNYWLIRKKKYFSVSSNKFVRRGTEGIFQILFALIKNPKGLIYSDIIGQSANAAVTTTQGFKHGFSFRYISTVKLKYVLRKYSDFPKFNLIPALMSTCSFFLPTLFINKFFSTVYTAYYDASKLLLSLPLVFIATAISNVLLQRVAEKYQQRESFVKELKPVFFVVTAICFAELLIILLFGTGIYKIVFGNDYSFSGEISKIMVWSFVLNFFVSSFSSVFISMQKIKIYSIWQFFYFLAISSLLFFKNLIFTDFLKVYVFIEVVCYLLLAGTIGFVIAKYERSLKEAVSKAHFL